MINSNPETVSTDYDTSDLLFFEPLTLEDTLNVIERLNGRDLTPAAATSRAAAPPSLVHGVIVQFGGQTPLNLAKGLLAAGAPIIGTSVDSIDRAEDRDRFDEVLSTLNLQRPAAGIARSIDQAVAEAQRIGYPVLIRPSYVLGGRGMEICSDEKALRSFITTALQTSGMDDAPVLIDKFLHGAIEVDVDVVADFADDGSGRAVVCGIMEQIEQAGVHSGDSACTLPPASLSHDVQGRIAALARAIAKELRVRGLMNIQLAVKDDDIYILEVNPRASRTVPFVGKATHIPWPAIAAKVMMGRTLDQLAAREPRDWGRPAPVAYWAIKESVFPFSKFPGVDVVLGPEMRSTGEVMGIDAASPSPSPKARAPPASTCPPPPTTRASSSPSARPTAPPSPNPPASSPRWASPSTPQRAPAPSSRASASPCRSSAKSPPALAPTSSTSCPTARSPSSSTRPPAPAGRPMKAASAPPPSASTSP